MITNASDIAGESQCSNKRGNINETNKVNEKGILCKNAQVFLPSVTVILINSGYVLIKRDSV